MKKSKHITINVNDAEYSMLSRIAEIDRRNITELCKLILIDNVIELYNNHYSKSDITPATYKR